LKLSISLIFRSRRRILPFDRGGIVARKRVRVQGAE
jgi:hypothetical protein